MLIWYRKPIIYTVSFNKHTPLTLRLARQNSPCSPDPPRLFFCRLCSIISIQNSPSRIPERGSNSLTRVNALFVFCTMSTWCSNQLSYNPMRFRTDGIIPHCRDDCKCKFDFMCLSAVSSRKTNRYNSQSLFFYLPWPAIQASLIPMKQQL